MKHKVLVPYENRKVFAFARRQRYQPEFSDWLISNFGPVAAGMWGTEKDLSGAGVTFKFKEASHAMMFKLMWSGS